MTTWPPDLAPDLTIAAVLKDLKHLLEGVSDTAELDARLLCAKALDCDGDQLVFKRQEGITREAIERLNGLVNRRLSKEPIAYILGEQEFWSLAFKVSPDTLIPRPDSETLVEAVLRSAKKDKHYRLLDLGTGSGALLIALLTELEESAGVAVDISQGALDVALKNAKQLGVGNRFRAFCGSWYASLPADTAPFDIILTNPPYIKSDIIPRLMADVKDFEPISALDGGDDGLEAYRAIIDGLDQWLSPDGFIALEIGYDQEASVSSLLKTMGFVVSVHHDLAGRARCLIGKRET